MYKLSPNSWNGSQARSVIRLSDGAAIPFAVDNSDYQQFKKDIKEGVELLDADGNVITDFVKELP